MIAKQVLIPTRGRRPATDGWSWIDRRFVRESAPRLAYEAIQSCFVPAVVSALIRETGNVPFCTVLRPLYC